MRRDPLSLFASYNMVCHLISNYFHFHTPSVENCLLILAQYFHQCRSGPCNAILNYEISRNVMYKTTQYQATSWSSVSVLIFTKMLIKTENHRKSFSISSRIWRWNDWIFRFRLEARDWVRKFSFFSYGTESRKFSFSSQNTRFNEANYRSRHPCEDAHHNGKRWNSFH